MFQSLGALLSNSVKKKGIFCQVEASMVCGKFKEIVAKMFGEKMRSVRPLYLKNGVLAVSVPNSVSAQELQLNQEKIIRQINDCFEKEAVRQFRFVA